MYPTVTCSIFGGDWLGLPIQTVKRPCSPRSVPTLAPFTLPGPMDESPVTKDHILFKSIYVKFPE